MLGLEGHIGDRAKMQKMQNARCFFERKEIDLPKEKFEDDAGMLEVTC